MMESVGHILSRTLPFAGSFGAAVVQPFDARLCAVNDNDDPEPPPAAAAPIPRVAFSFLAAYQGRLGKRCLRGLV